MAWTTPTHSCGHQGERYQAYGPGAARKRELAAIEAQPCPACRAAAARAQSEAAGLLILEGTAKQMVWATDIRDRALRMHPEIEQVLRTEPSASWFIENRFELESLKKF